MRYAIIKRNEEYQVISYPENSDPLYGYGSWDLYNTYNTQANALLALDFICLFEDYLI